MIKLKQLILLMLWPRYIRGGNPHSFSLVFKHWFIQKFLRINSHVDWPISPSSVVKCPDNIKRGSRTPGLSMGCYLDARNGIELGDNVWLGPRASLISMNHDPLDYNKYLPAPPIVIGDNCWLGANSVILPGVSIAPHTIIAAGSVVNKSFEQGNIVLAGVPAKIVKHIPEYNCK